MGAILRERAGEIGVMCMGPQFVDVDYGERGCFETLAGLHFLAFATLMVARFVAHLAELADRSLERVSGAVQRINDARFEEPREEARHISLMKAAGFMAGS